MKSQTILSFGFACLSLGVAPAFGASSLSDVEVVAHPHSLECSGVVAGAAQGAQIVVDYATSADMAGAESATIATVAAPGGAFSAYLRGLVPEQVYYVRVSAVDASTGEVDDTYPATGQNPLSLTTTSSGELQEK